MVVTADGAGFVSGRSWIFDPMACCLDLNAEPASGSGQGPSDSGVREGDTTLELEDDGEEAVPLRRAGWWPCCDGECCDAIVSSRHHRSTLDLRSFIRKCARGAASNKNRSRSYIPKENTHVTARAICVGFHIRNGMREAIVAGDGIVAH